MNIISKNQKFMTDRTCSGDIASVNVQVEVCSCLDQDNKHCIAKSGSVRQSDYREKMLKKNLRQKIILIPDYPDIRQAFTDLAEAVKKGRITTRQIKKIIDGSENDGVDKGNPKPTFIKKIKLFLINFLKHSINIE